MTTAALPPLLALDTSSEVLALAASVGDRTAVWEGPGGAQASEHLLPQAVELLAQLGLRVQDLGAVAFAQGPGAFTGLRTACAVAQGLAFGLGCRVVPVGSLAVVAEAARAAWAPAEPAWDVGVAMDARMGELYVARYGWAGGAWVEAQPAQVCTPDRLEATWGGWPPVLAGNATGVFGWPAERPCADPPGRAGALLRLAQTHFLAGGGVDPAQAVPVYVRDKVAQTTQERERLAAQRVTTA